MGLKAVRGQGEEEELIEEKGELRQEEQTLRLFFPQLNHFAQVGPQQSAVLPQSHQSESGTLTFGLHWSLLPWR